MKALSGWVMQLWLLTFFFFFWGAILQIAEGEVPSRGHELASPSCGVPAGRLWSSPSRCAGLQGPASVPCQGQHGSRSPQRAHRLLARTRAVLGEVPLHGHVLSTASYIGHVPLSVSINYTVSSQALRNYHLHSSLGAFGECFWLLFPRGKWRQDHGLPFWVACARWH